MGQPATGTPGSFGYNDQGQLINSAQPTNYILAFILGALQSGLAAIVLAVGGGSSTVGTYTYFHVAASGTLSGGIPVTAKRWTVNFVGAGTSNTFGTNTSLTGGQSFSDNATPAVAIAITCDGSTVADGFYSTT